MRGPRNEGISNKRVEAEASRAASSLETLDRLRVQLRAGLRADHGGRRAAQAAPDDVSEGLGKFLGGQAAGVDLDSIAEAEGAYAESPSGVNPVDANPLSAEVLNSVGVNLNDSLQLLGPNWVISLGAVNQYGQAEDSGYAAAASGAVNDQGPSHSVAHRSSPPMPK